MGHIDSSMAGHYRERISDERLRMVVECVRNWLFSERKHMGENNLPEIYHTVLAREITGRPIGDKNVPSARVSEALTVCQGDET